MVQTEKKKHLVIDYIIVFFVALTTILLEMLYTKILSFVFWSHVVYIIITLALLGMGISSTFIIIFRDRIRERHGGSMFISVNLLLFGLAALASLVVLQTVQVSSTPTGFLAAIPVFISVYGLFTLPFFFAGNVLIYIFYQHPEASGRLYFCDLVGAAAGCLTIPVLIKNLGGAAAAAYVAGGIAAVSAGYLLLYGRSKRAKAAGTVIGVSIAASSLFFGVGIDLRPDRTKSLGTALDRHMNRETSVDFTGWDFVTRVDVVSGKEREIDLRWGKIPSGSKLVTFDGDAISLIVPKDDSFPSLKDRNSFVEKDLHAVFFEKIMAGDHLIIGLGGGPDIVRSLAMGARSITGVEINETIIDVMKTRFAPFSGDVFNRKSVTINHGEGRSFIRRSPRKFDLIQMTGVDTFTALNTGSYVMAENYLYTVDAVRDYFSSLSDDGVLCIHRWFYDQKPRESLRLFSVILSALKAEGVENPELHVAVIRPSFGTGITFVRKKAFTAEEVRKVEGMLTGREGNPQIIFLAGATASGNPAVPYYAAFARSFHDGTTAGFHAEYEYDVSPVDDNKPFFFNYYKPSAFLKAPLQAVTSTGIVHGYWPYLVFSIIFLTASLAVIMFIWVPLVVLKRDGLIINGVVPAVTYFSGLGLGFIMLEITLMQKFALFLGHPMYSITTILGGLLFFAGIGSYLSARSERSPLAKVTLATMAVIVMGSFFIWGSKPAFHFLLGFPLQVRIAVTLVGVLPLGLALGVFFPTGLAVVGSRAAAFVPWAWGINSGFTVIGSILTIILAMALGFNAVIGIAMTIYIVTLIALRFYVHKFA